MATGNRDLVKRLHEEVWTHRKYEVLDEVCAPDCKFYDPMHGDRPVGLAEYKLVMSQFDESFAVDDVPLDRVVEAGDVTVFLWRLTVHMKDDGAAKGRIGKTSGMGLIEVRGGKIVEHRSAWDTLRFFQGLGLVPPLALPTGTAPQPAARPGT